VERRDSFKFTEIIFTVENSFEDEDSSLPTSTQECSSYFLLLQLSSPSTPNFSSRSSNRINYQGGKE